MPISGAGAFAVVLHGGTGYFSRPQSRSIVDADGSGSRKLTFGPAKTVGGREKLGR